ncbi:MAG: formate dehydrogenase subunit alpha [Syntrophobacteraceae bacterium CG07_land_8_20_14_0_80_61_8]|nr:MAG: formate dehydrogenase subunit alpha [Syntrophobacteraceae bacterium CG07_land_8_20_14_0_80_61_8]
MVKLTIDGREVLARPEGTILQVAKNAGIRIPTLCFHERLKPIGSCGMCVVEVAGNSTPVAACETQVAAGMAVTTHSDRLFSMRQDVLKAILVHHPLDCPICDKAGQCLLQDLVYEHGISGVEAQAPTSKFTAPYATTFIKSNPERCVLCLRCVHACTEIQGIGALSMADGPDGKRIAYDRDKCVSCGECIQVCPVGAMVEKKTALHWRSWQTEQKVRTTCPYCGCGCQQLLHVKDGRIIKVSGVEDGLPNQGRLCVKGRFGYDFIYSDERLKTPLIRENGGFREASWDQALRLVATRFKEIIAKHGPDALAGVSCSRSINEDSYQMQKLFRSVFGTNNIDNCARTCHAPSVSGLAMSFGSGAMTNSITEFAKAKMIFVIGSNMTEAHPIAATYVKNAARTGAVLIVADPRRTELSDHAALYLPIKVGSDIAFLNGLMNVLITEDLYDRNYVDSCCTGFEELKSKVLEYPPERVAELSGIPADTIRETARKMAATRPGMLAYTLGITEHTCGVHNVISTANLQMMLGNVGFECSGVNALRGQNNVQGACDMGALPNVFPGYQKVDDPKAQAKFRAAWGVDSLPDKPGLMMPDMIEGLRDGKIKGFYIFGENLANSEPDIAHVEKCLAAAEFLVCQDNFQTETTRFAHVILPAAAWSENDGTFVNCERRVSMVRKASEPPGVAMPNWWIFKEIARRMGHEWASSSAGELWDNEISRLAPILAGIKYARLEGDGLQWPVPDENHCGTPVMHQNGRFTRGRGRFIPVDWTPPAEVPDQDYPFVLSTGRRLYHYHTRTQTGRAVGLNDLMGEETLDISPTDARRLAIANGEKVRVKSRRGAVNIKARITDRINPGMVWMSFHFRKTCANWLTNPVFDPICKTAEYKACAVAVEKL